MGLSPQNCRIQMGKAKYVHEWLKVFLQFKSHRSFQGTWVLTLTTALSVTTKGKQYGSKKISLLNEEIHVALKADTMFPRLNFFRKCSKALPLYKFKAAVGTDYPKGIVAPNTLPKQIIVKIWACLAELGHENSINIIRAKNLR